MKMKELNMLVVLPEEVPVSISPSKQALLAVHQKVLLKALERVKQLPRG